MYRKNSYGGKSELRKVLREKKITENKVLGLGFLRRFVSQNRVETANQVSGKIITISKVLNKKCQRKKTGNKFQRLRKLERRNLNRGN